MTFRERLNNLDETGIGEHKKISAAERKKINEETVAAIRAHRELMKKNKKKKAS